MYSGCAKYQEVDILEREWVQMEIGIDTRCGWGDAFYVRTDS